MSWVKKLQDRWELTSGWQVLIILIVFACTGFTSLYAKEFVYWVFNIDKETLATWQKVCFTIFVTLPIYQILLLAYGFLFGQFAFFWKFEKKMINRFRFKKKNDQPE